jgi:hypothetical protein
MIIHFEPEFFSVSNGTVNFGMNSFDVQMQIGIINWRGEC